VPKVRPAVAATPGTPPPRRGDAMGVEWNDPRQSPPRSTPPRRLERMQARPQQSRRPTFTRAKQVQGRRIRPLVLRQGLDDYRVFKLWRASITACTNRTSLRM